MAKPSKFVGANIILKGNGVDVVDLQARKQPDGSLWSCWQLDESEIAEVLHTGRVWLGVLTFGDRPQPIMCSGHAVDVLPDARTRPADAVVVSRDDWERLKEKAGEPDVKTLYQKFEEEAVRQARAFIERSKNEPSEEIVQSTGAPPGEDPQFPGLPLHPTRLSIYVDPLEYCNQFDVLLDGKAPHRCTVADVERGFVDVIGADDHGTVIISKLTGQPQIIRREGKVEIVRRDSR